MKPVIFESHKTICGSIISVIKLNAPESLNALTLEMVALIQDHLNEVRTKDNIVAIIFDSVIDKAFCSGGNVVSIAKAIKKDNIKVAEQFFSSEYKLDLDIHLYPKPIICIANGIVLGGGVGLMNGCSHRIVTDTTYMAMPEISIGLFPDVGGSWFLNKIPNNIGVFLGLTAIPLNCSDALHLSLADYIINHKLKNQIIELLCDSSWRGSPFYVVDNVLNNLQNHSYLKYPTPPSKIKEYSAFIQEFVHQDNINNIVRIILNYQTNDLWIKKAQKNLSYGSPLSAVLIYNQLYKAKDLSLEDVFKFEYELALTTCQQGDFYEGVRALLIDKDHSPKWKYSNIESIEVEFIQSFFK
jgi:enoyl-CoA hydratase/carnithine racemase